MPERLRFWLQLLIFVPFCLGAEIEVAMQVYRGGAMSCRPISASS